MSKIDFNNSSIYQYLPILADMDHPEFLRNDGIFDTLAIVGFTASSGDDLPAIDTDGNPPTTGDSPSPTETSSSAQTSSLRRG